MLCVVILDDRGISYTDYSIGDFRCGLAELYAELDCGLCLCCLHCGEHSLAFAVSDACYILCGGEICILVNHVSHIVFLSAGDGGQGASDTKHQAYISVILHNDPVL